MARLPRPSQGISASGDFSKGGDGRMARNERLLESLRHDVDRSLPAGNANQAPAWAIFMFPQNPAAPVVTISRDPRAGELAVPVFFVGMADDTELHEWAGGLSNKLAPLWHSQSGHELPNYVVVPAMYHMLDADEFVSTMTQVLEAAEQSVELAWFWERCEVQITHAGRSYKARRTPEGLLNVLITQHVAPNNQGLQTRLDALLVASKLGGPALGAGAEAKRTVPLPSADELAALLETVRIQLEDDFAGSRFPLFWRLGLALASEAAQGWVGHELDQVVQELEVISTELERLPLGLAASVCLGDEGFPEIYSRVTPTLEGTNLYHPPNLRTRFETTLRPLRTVCVSGKETRSAIALVRDGVPLTRLWSARDLGIDS